MSVTMSVFDYPQPRMVCNRCKEVLGYGWAITVTLPHQCVDHRVLRSTAREFHLAKGAMPK